MHGRKRDRDGTEKVHDSPVQCAHCRSFRSARSTQKATKIVDAISTKWTKCSGEADRAGLEHDTNTRDMGRQLKEVNRSEAKVAVAATWPSLLGTGSLAS